jgi:hypothetical protein
MENRIQVNGTWYVREDSTPPRGIILTQNDVTHFQGAVYEDDEYCFEASKIYRNFEGNEKYDDSLDIEVTFKSRGIPMNEWEKEYWDHLGFFKGILENNPESLDTLSQNLTPEGVKTFKAFLVYLKGINWL